MKDAILKKLAREKWKVARLETIVETKTRDLYRANQNLEQNLSQLKHTQEIEQELIASRHAQQLMHADRLAAIGTLAAGVAHEINNPATFVLANIEFLSEIAEKIRKTLNVTDGPAHEGYAGNSGQALPPLLDELEELLDECMYGVERICATTKELVPFSRVAPELPGSIDINKVVAMAIKIASNEVRHRAEVTTDLACVPPLIGDQGKLCQVLVNLLINASHAMKDSSSSDNKILVKTKTDQGCLIVSVSDTGCGMSSDQQEAIFKPFFTTKVPERGTGLGLAISAEIVRKHGGSIQVKSGIGRGSTFVISLPYENPFSTLRVSDQTIHTKRKAEEIVKKQTRILVIDDEALIRKTLWRMLKSHHEIVQAGSGKEALACLNNDDEFDAILCDIMMPDIDGPGIHKWLCENRPALVPHMIFISGGAVTDKASKFVEAGDITIVEKPIRLPTLLAAIDKIL